MLHVTVIYRSFESELDNMVHIFLIPSLSRVLIALTLIGVIAVFDPFGGYHSDKSLNDKLWEKRFRCWCCCVGKGDSSSHGAFQDLAKIFSSQVYTVIRSDLPCPDLPCHPIYRALIYRVIRFTVP